MALNPYTLYHLYEKGILEYVPTDLMSGSAVSPMMSLSNPYLDMAAQGNLYQNHGIYNDSFRLSGAQSAYEAQSGNVIPQQAQIGSLSQAGGMNMFSGVNIGALSQAGGLNAYNGVGIGAQSQAGGLNTFGGFADVQNRLANGYYTTKSTIDRIPKIFLGLGAAAIGILGLKYGFKSIFHGKKTANKTSFWSKLNPFKGKLISKKS